MKPKTTPRKRYSAKNASLVTLLIVLTLYLYLNKDIIESKYHRNDKFKDTHAVTADTTNLHTLRIKEIHFRPFNSTGRRKYGQVILTPELVADAKDRFSEAVSVSGSRSEGQEEDDAYDTKLWSKSDSNPWTHEFKLKQQTIQMTRMAYRDPDYVESFLDFANENPTMAQKVHLEWVDENVLAPNVTDKDTIISLALMSSNAYVPLPFEGDWRNISGWDHDANPDFPDGIGWDADGVRGHIFTNEDSSVVVIAIKGTSAQGLPGSGDDATTENDKLNDNLLFSCCCARVSYLWTTACDCYVKSYTCDETCLEKELNRKDRYYQAVLDIYRTVIEDHPNAAIWITGHSLGGALASLLGRTFGAPAVAFEAPGELLATRRLHLPIPPGLPSYQEGIWHIGHTADPIFMGTCNGASSSCSIAGYAMETSCHSGKVCIYDVVTDKGWHVNMLNHRIHTVIDGVLNDYENVAKCEVPEPCNDCFNWKYIRGRDEPHSSSVTSSSSATNKKPTTSVFTSTTSLPATTSSAEKTTSSCIGRNWIGICTRYGI
ncbi:putative lipase ATG15 [Kluyveromyces marxianus]|uniref:Putative lipase ATG15 n=1 Tax=Kluyveromyces marxianus TaxID=4911 RepID=A0ABX6ET63_KLUMA|nr:putative lipase ATG15 [Kluyveromyces marxianus]BAP71283.1 putative lipase ATG15 [Kluyveromyces marxianus]